MAEFSKRKRAEQAIANSQSFIHNGKLYTSVSELPSDAEFALSTGDEAVEQTKAAIRAQMMRLMADMELLGGDTGETKETSKSEPKGEANRAEPAKPAVPAKKAEETK